MADDTHHRTKHPERHGALDPIRRRIVPCAHDVFQAISLHIFLWLNVVCRDERHNAGSTIAWKD